MSTSNTSTDQQPLESLRCDICDVPCATLYNLTQHMNGKRHKSQVQGVKTAKVVQCTICEVLVGGDFSIHENGKKHQQLLKGTKESKPPPPATTSPAPVSTATTTTPVSDAAPATLNIPPPRLRPVPITIHCNMCDQDLDGNDWVTHLEDLKHLRHERLARHSAMIWDSEQDKCGIKVEEKLLDFGLIDAETLRDDWIVMGSLHFSLTSQCRVELVEAEMTSNLDPLNEDMPTYFTVFSEALQAEYGTRYTIYILFEVKDRPKRYEDRIELVFKDVDLQQHFIITRPVQAMVAVEGDIDLLRPVSASFYESSVIPTPETNIPQHIYDAYGSIEEQTDRLRKKLLPSELNSETYRCYWKTLLWVEELSLSNDLRRYDTTSIFQESMSGTTLLYTSVHL
ncbi:hypothetical protein FRC02_003599 [Tulasnella sp. 418]|nr:hypothetical protein FRC02_003599 [Tulasnella sp. 418]